MEQKSIVSRVLDAVFSHNLLRIVLVVMVLLRSCTFLSPIVGPFVKVTLVWSVVILIHDLFTRRLLLTNRFRGILYLFLIAYGITTLVNWRVNLVRNVVMLAALAMAAATCSYHWRRGDKPFTVVPLAAFAGLSFPADIGAFGLPGPGSDFVASLPNVYAKVPANIMVALFQLAVFVAALIILTYNLIGRAHYVDT